MSPNAKFIKDNLKYTCNICSDEIETNKVIGLGCNLSKHIFCYDCIYDWYKELKKKKYCGNYTILNMCPICRKNGGLLPLIENIPFIKGLHYISNLKKTEYDVCGYKLCSKNGYCQLKSNKLYGGFCGKHKPKQLTDIEHNEDLSQNINPNKLHNECGVKLKTKNGYCKSKGSKIYGGYCGLHKNVISLSEDENTDPIII